MATVTLKKLVVAGLLMIAATGCQSVVPVTGPFEVDNAYEVTLNKTWAAYPRDGRTRLRNLTIDGTALNSLTFAGSLDDGHALIKTYDRKKLLPKFDSTMSLLETVEFIRDSLEYGGLQDAAVDNVRPATFGSLDGARFDITGATELGLYMSGIGQVAIEEGRLHLIVYTAPSEYYFGLHEDEVNAILDSVRLM